MENTKQIQSILREMGIKGQFKPYREAETGAILLHVKRPAKIVEGWLVGEVIDLYSHTPPIFRVWTAHTKKAKACAARHGLRVSLLDGEACIFIPAHLADALLHRFGAKIKRIVSDATRAKLKASWFKRNTA